MGVWCGVGAREGKALRWWWLVGLMEVDCGGGLEWGGGGGGVRVRTARILKLIQRSRDSIVSAYFVNGKIITTSVSYHKTF